MANLLHLLNRCTNIPTTIGKKKRTQGKTIFPAVVSDQKNDGGRLRRKLAAPYWKLLHLPERQQQQQQLQRSYWKKWVKGKIDCPTAVSGQNMAGDRGEPTEPTASVQQQQQKGYWQTAAQKERIVSLLVDMSTAKNQRET